jgi:hypothetical protein
MASKAKDDQEKVSGNKYKGTGIVPPVVQQMIEGSIRTAKPKEKLSPYQQKVLLRQSA